MEKQKSQVNKKNIDDSDVHDIDSSSGRSADAKSLDHENKNEEIRVLSPLQNKNNELNSDLRQTQNVNTNHDNTGGSISHKDESFTPNKP